MRTWVRHSLNAGALTAGVLLVSGAAAHASPALTTGDNIGVGNGTQALVPVQAPINICGNAVGIGGSAFAACEGGAAAALEPEWRFDHFRRGATPHMVTTDNLGVGNGTQLHAPVQVPVNVCGNAVSVLGTAGAGCEGGAEADGDRDKPEYDEPDKPGNGYEHHDEGEHAGHHPAMVTSRNVGILNGTQALVPIQIPINICGNAISLLGSAQAGCEGGSHT